MTRYAVWSAACAVTTAISLFGAWLQHRVSPLALMIPVVVAIGHLPHPWRAGTTVAAGFATAASALALGDPAAALWLSMGVVVAHLLGDDTRTLIDELRIESARTLSRIQESVVVDPVTGALNRAGLELVAPPIIAAARRRGDAVYAACVRLDGLEEFLAREGRLATDLLIKEVAETLRLAVRASDLVARTGQDTFHIVGPGRGVSAEALRRRCEALILHRHDPMLDTWPGLMHTEARILPPWNEFTDLTTFLEQVSDDGELEAA